MIFYYKTGHEWTSGILRGKQIASRIDGAVCNPKYPVSTDQPFIFVKCVPPANVIQKVKDLYIDAVDHYGILIGLVGMPRLNVIAISDLAADFMSSFMDNKIVVIRHHHCNFELNTRQTGRPVKTVGYCGDILNFHLDIDVVSEALAQEGFNVVWCTDTVGIGRDGICNFYKDIDIQIAYRNIDRRIKFSHQVPCMKNPLKLANAGSFKIPTVCFPEPSYVDEFRDMFIPVADVKGLVDGCVKLRDERALYEDLSNAAYEKSKDFDIEKVVELYKELECV